MKITRPSCEITVRNETDVLVIGAGPAGIGAAISAARAGAKVTLVEYGGKLGGMWTLGLLSPFFDNRIHQGLNEELRTHLADFIDAYNFARRLKTLNGLTPYEYISKIWTSEPERFIIDPIHQMPGLNN